MTTSLLDRQIAVANFRVLLAGNDKYVASYVNNGTANLTTYGNSLVTAAAKYKDVFPITSDTQANNYAASALIKGMAVNETSTDGNNSTSAWNSNFSYIPYSSAPFFTRGGCWANDAVECGLYAFSYHTGAVNGNYMGFRVCLAPQ